MCVYISSVNALFVYINYVQFGYTIYGYNKSVYILIDACALIQFSLLKLLFYNQRVHLCTEEMAALTSSFNSKCWAEISGNIYR